MVGRKAIVTICVGVEYTKIANVTHPTLKEYADKIGADFHVITEQSWRLPHPTYHKFELGKYFKQLGYKKVLYVDSDIIIKKDSPDIFECVPENSFAAFNEGKYLDRRPAIVNFLRELADGGGAIGKEWLRSGTYFNTGVMVFNGDFTLTMPLKPIQNFYEQTQYNWEFLKAQKELGWSYHNLHHSWNRMSHMDKVTGEQRFEANFIHYAGANRHGLVEVINKDIDTLNNVNEFKKNIFILPSGGMGDVIASEPVVRFIIDEMYPGCNAVVQSVWPDIFSHLSDRATLISTDNKINDVGYYEFHLYPKPENHFNEYVSHALTHPTDYASLVAIKGQIPVYARQPKLPVKELPKDIEEAIKHCVLIHPGKGWESKTFDANWWERVCYEIKKSGRNVAIIGRNLNDDQGVVEFDRTPYLDLVNKTTTLETFRCIQLAPVLISNDSMPIHAAGAFDNWIGLLATCKHPDRILPYRKGSIYYKALVLSKQLLEYEYRPTYTETVTMDFADREQVQKCLCEPKEIVDWLNTILV